MSAKPRTSTPRRSSSVVGGGGEGGLKRASSSSSVLPTKSEVGLGNNAGNESFGSVGNVSGNKTGAVPKLSTTVNIKQALAGSTNGEAWGDAGFGGSLLQTVPIGLDIKTRDSGTNEKILHDICSLYNQKELVGAAKTVRVEITKPKQQIVVLLVGNHSAGKSSFINWYIQDSIMKTGVAIETQGINFILHGNRRETLKGSATLQLFPELGKLRTIPGVVANMVTEVSPSRARLFESVVFVDTPGLVDGHMNYPFDINKTLLALGGMADLIFFFFEPIGQALCRRTVDILEEMWADSIDAKIRLFLAKADEAGGDSERQKVMMQIVQELCKRSRINRSGFDMPAIYIPGMAGINEANRGSSFGSLFSNRNLPKPKCANQIDETCKEIEKAVKMNVQNALDNLETDCNEVLKKIQGRLTEDDKAKQMNYAAFQRKTSIWLMIFSIFVLMLAESFTKELNFKGYSLISKFGKPLRSLASGIIFNLTGSNLTAEDLVSSISWDWKTTFGAACFILACKVIIDAICNRAEMNVMLKKDRAEMEGKKNDLEKIQYKQKTLYKSFLAQSIPGMELEVSQD